MITQSATVNQLSAAPIIGVKMQKLDDGDHFPIANTAGDCGMISRYKKIPTDGNYIVVIQGGEIGFVRAEAGALSLLNNNLGWTQTTNCE